MGGFLVLLMVDGWREGVWGLYYIRVCIYAWFMGLVCLLCSILFDYVSWLCSYTAVLMLVWVAIVCCSRWPA